MIRGQVKPKLGLVAVISVLVGLIGVLAYGVSSECSYCGVALPGLWGVAILVVLPIWWGLTRPSKETQICIKNHGTCDHEFVHDEYEEVLGWHGDTPIWCTVKVTVVGNVRIWKTRIVS
jgi:hypothetical protein